MKEHFRKAISNHIEYPKTKEFQATHHVTSIHLSPPSQSSINHSIFSYLRKFEFISLKVHQLLLNKNMQKSVKCLSIILCAYSYQIVSTRTKTNVILYRYECIISAFHLKVAILSKGNHISALKLLIFMQVYFFPLMPSLYTFELPTSIYFFHL